MTASLEYLGKQVKNLQLIARSIQRDMAMLRAQQAELPTVAQFLAGLTSMDEHAIDLHLETLAAIQALTELVKESK